MVLCMGRANTLHRGVREVFASKRPTARQRASVRQGRGLTARAPRRARPPGSASFLYVGLMFCLVSDDTLSALVGLERTRR